jgi:hypothetical protein
MRDVSKSWKQKDRRQILITQEHFVKRKIKWTPSRVRIFL